MAFVDKIWIHPTNKENGTIRAYVKLKPAGEVAVDFKMSDGFIQCILPSSGDSPNRRAALNVRSQIRRQVERLRNGTALERIRN